MCIVFIPQQTKKSVDNCYIDKCDRFAIRIDFCKYQKFASKCQLKNKKKIENHIIFGADRNENTELSKTQIKIMIVGTPFDILANLGLLTKAIKAHIYY